MTENRNDKAQLVKELIFDGVRVDGNGNGIVGQR